MRSVIIGFDSAWTDSPKSPGAVAACVLDGPQRMEFVRPCLATFGQALDFIRKWSAAADYVLIAIDQPTIVPNTERSRPVDRVAGSLVSKLGGGVQPARRGGLGAPMFGDAAPIWNFLAKVGAIQNPMQARSAEAGCFLIEVFPALSLPAIVPEIWQRGRAAKYNPSTKKFRPLDWQLVASGVATFARGLGSQDLAGWLEDQSSRTTLRKADQDMLDAAICLAIGLAWRQESFPDTLLLGDERNGYIATIACSQTRAILVKAANERVVPIDRRWEGGVSLVAAD